MKYILFSHKIQDLSYLLSSSFYTRIETIRTVKSTHSTPRSEARGMLRVDTERRFLPRFKNRGLAPSNLSKWHAFRIIFD